jgi:hypothetical protein
VVTGALAGDMTAGPPGSTIMPSLAGVSSPSCPLVSVNITVVTVGPVLASTCGVPNVVPGSV